MSARDLLEEEEFADSEAGKDPLVMRVVALERELMKVRRTEKVLYETEQRYLTLMDSAVFLYMLLSPSGVLRMMNHRAEEFLGFHLKFGVEVTLQSLSGPGYTGEVEFVLKDALRKSTRVTLPVVRADGALGWLDMEFAGVMWQGSPAVQCIAFDVTELVRGQAETPPPSDYGPAWALPLLSSCPGLLCFAVDREGVLLYATRGYREVAGRFLGHECVCGLVYPASLDTAFDMELHELIFEACEGKTGMTSLMEKGEESGSNQWDVTVAPLVASTGSIAGAVVYLTTHPKSLAASPETPPEPEPEEAKDEVEEPRFSKLALQTELLNALPGMCVVLDENGICLEASEPFFRVLGLRGEKAAGRAFWELGGGNSASDEALREKILHRIRHGWNEAMDCQFCTQEGESLWLTLEGVSVQWGEKSATLVHCLDNTRLHRTEEQLKRMSTTDSCTGALNRAGMERVLETEVERALRYRGSLSMIVFDIDGFRELNERIGYAACDRVLKELVNVFRSRVRSTDFLGRWGGDEFMVLIPLPVSAGIQFAEQVRDMIDHQTLGDETHLTVSAGVAELRKGMDVPTLVALAYDAMIEAKKSGGNRSKQAQEPVLAETADSSA
ncbi:MAG: diguanylate cyclase [Synergistaceae bacterium]|nr:diguanylate cyclase [Synergistaceae bacterium]